MTANTANPTSPLLRSEGWKACVDARLMRSSDSWEDAPEFRAHGHTLRRFFTELNIDAVLCTEGRPSVCIKDTRDLSPAEVETLRHHLWNLGSTTLLIAEGKHDVRVFSTFVKPQPDNVGKAAELPNETIQTLQAVELAMRLRQLICRVETGAIYRDHESLFDPQFSVDRSLLENLREVRDLICPTKTAKGYRQTHALIGRFLFSCYLFDRQIIGRSYLHSVELPEADDMLGLLQVATDGPQALEALFKSLQRDFNGSLFGPLLDGYQIKPAEVEHLKRFLSGEHLRTGQLSLFKLYDFGFIPVELISSIYEEFLGAEAEAEREEAEAEQRLKSNKASNAPPHSQRSLGAYYTPPRLAELVVDIGTHGWNTLLDKHCFDPACGSGVFLVILFIRMAEEWRKRNPEADTRRRYQELMRLLTENLRGMDVHPTACFVSCFSLYLAFLDQMEPKEIIELKELLDRDTKERILPRILWEQEKPRPRQPHFATIRELDFFDLPVEKEFDLVIGNPPWVSRKPAPAVENWLFSVESNPYLGDMDVKELNQSLFPAHELACGFMWKAGLHTLTTGRVCQVLPSRVFLSNNTDRFQEAWLKHHRLETLWLLADWRFILFPNADCPCFIGRYHPRGAHEVLGEFEFVTPKVELIDPREALIPVLPEDQKILSEVDIVAAARRKEAAAAWKGQHWGTPRDVRLLERLMKMPRLNKLAKRPPREKLRPSQRRTDWYKGQGFQPATESTTVPEPIFWKESDRFLAAGAPVYDFHLLWNDSKPIGSLYKEKGLHRKRSPLIYEAPLLLINKACTKFLFSDFDVLFQDDFQSISVPKDQEDELLFLTAVLSSQLAQYLLFHTTANIGIERDVARLEEILELPFPLPKDTQNPKRSQSIVRETANRLRDLRAEMQKPKNLLNREPLIEAAREDLEKLVYEYFEMCRWEWDLVRDTVQLFRPSSTPPSILSETLLTAAPSQPSHRKEYAETLVRTFRDWSKTGRHLWAETHVASKVGLALVTFGLGNKPRKYSESQVEDNVMKVLDSIRDMTAEKGVLFSRLKGFALYEPDKVHVLKPLNRRHWTRTAALNDADEMLTRMMKEDGWRG